MKMGTAKYGGEHKKKVYAKLKDGEAMYRILPPLGELADKGIWSVFWNVHYGYTNSAGKLRTFASPLVKNHKTKMIEVPDAAYERIQKLKAQMEQAKLDGNTELFNKLTVLVGGAKPKFNLDSNHYMNAVDAAGNIVVLQLRHTAMKLLKIEIDALRAKSIDPLGADSGRYFVFRRTGMALDTSFKVSVAKESIDVPGVGTVERDRVHVLDQGLINRLSSEAAELGSLYKTPSSADVARIVAEGPIAVDAILDSKGGSPADDIQDLGAEVAAAPVAAPAPVAAQPAAVPAAAVKPVAQAPVAAPAPAATPAVASMDDAEFLKSMGL